MACKVATGLSHKASSSEITIRDALASDAAAIALLGANTFTTAFGFSVPPRDLANYLAATYSARVIELEIHDAQLTTLVARDDQGVLLGFVQLVRGPTAETCLRGDPASHAKMRRLYVDTMAHGRGIGSKLIAAVESRAKVEGFGMLWLTVWEDNADAQRLYQRLGYVKLGDADFVLGDCIQTDWVLAKEL
ncbi:acetyltransferase [Xylariaceae sp. FL0662B]|nr:acetyltransferase [Xylariaceae sp. FL0662B]